mmetsp:Transcript_89937/g.259200  ORF Transcript_89937/g.259200 Transcript_89937/m.259200 type:complete len:309 (+) Transcript_89937:328-1254(+)
MELVEHAVLQVGGWDAISALARGRNGPLAAEQFPEVIIQFAHRLGAAQALALEALSHEVRLVPLERARLGSIVDVDLAARVEDEAIALVHGAPGQGHLLLHDAELRLPHLEEASREVVGDDMVEARINASGEVRELREQRPELPRLLALDLPALGGLAIQEVVELHSLVGGRAHLIDRCLLSEPEEDVELQVFLDLLGVQDDVRVAGVEAPMPGLRPCHHFESLDPPDQHTGLLPDATPRQLGHGRGLPQGLVLVAADAGAVGLFQRHAVPVPRLGRQLLRHHAVSLKLRVGASGKKFAQQARMLEPS